MVQALVCPTYPATMTLCSRSTQACAPGCCSAGACSAPHHPNKYHQRLTTSGKSHIPRASVCQPDALLSRSIVSRPGLRAPGQLALRSASRVIFCLQSRLEQRCALSTSPIARPRQARLAWSPDPRYVRGRQLGSRPLQWFPGLGTQPVVINCR